MRTDESGVVWVRVTHPTTNGEAEVTKAAFDEVYEEKGWVLNEDDRTLAAPAPVESVPTSGFAGFPSVEPGEDVVVNPATSSRERK